MTISPLLSYGNMQGTALGAKYIGKTARMAVA
jgi:hypothetical protein